ncbi:MAG: hypothetical protein SFV81_25410 [Pirellulaceae bacterium]|nr:hypothetical protein [Pirellulaceae bacterium]
MTQPRLLLYPFQFESIRTVSTPPGSLTSGDGDVIIYTQGFVSAWFPSESNRGPDCSLLSDSYPGGFDCFALQLRSTSWAESSLATADRVQPTKTLPLVNQPDLNRIIHQKAKEAKIEHVSQELRVSLTSGYISEDEQYVYVAAIGDLFDINKSLLFDTKEIFRFEEKQDTFTLSGDKPNKVRYSAPGAKNYQLQLWYKPQIASRAAPAISLESTNGEFEIAFDPQVVAQNAMRLPSSSEARITKEHLSTYAKKITPAFKQLTGKNPRTLCMPVYVLVVAEHAEGKQKASLVHSYLVEVPVKLLQALMQSQ